MMRAQTLKWTSEEFAGFIILAAVGGLVVLVFTWLLVGCTPAATATGFGAGLAACELAAKVDGGESDASAEEWASYKACRERVLNDYEFDAGSYDGGLS